MEANYRRISVAAKNIDTREHDIADSDDYFQYHGGMIATVRALTGPEPKAYVGDSTTPDAVRTRTLSEETARVFRARVVNPRWIAAMQRHGYKGAFELAATVDYLFGFDATAGVVHDWMYEQLASSYVLDKQNQDFLRQANPWALSGIIEKLSEAADRGLWAEPDPETMGALQQVYLDVEGDLEDRADEARPRRRCPARSLDFLAERHLATLTTLRRDGTPHVVPVGFTYDADDQDRPRDHQRRLGQGAQRRPPGRRGGDLPGRRRPLAHGQRGGPGGPRPRRDRGRGLSLCPALPAASGEPEAGRVDHRGEPDDGLQPVRLIRPAWR